MELTQDERDELEQLLLYTLYPENYRFRPIDKNILLDILDKLETERDFDNL